MREEGYYFVKLKYSKKWTIARFTGILDWYYNGLRLKKDDFDEIGDKIDLPNN